MEAGFKGGQGKAQNREADSKGGQGKAQNGSILDEAKSS
ncbi:hypothetical protein CASFOL_028236 [Castilleja foliolosa]|uniref:Stress-induced protein n=1 Tax=Castilleja foliolosa TaxID=1961234 RepID=A0ABD3CFK8_9LAMI